MTRARRASARRAPRRLAAWTVAAVLFVVAWLPLAGPAAAEPPQVREQVVHVGDRSVRALCTPGPREVLLVQADALAADAWRPVLERLEGVVGACAYDRMPVESGSRGWFELMDAMHRAHDALGFGSGYTLVGQGLGGLYARLYAVGRPTDIGALVLVDPAHEDWADEARHSMPSVAWEAWQHRRSKPNTDGIVEVELAEHARGTRLGDIPVTVITAGRRPDGGGWDARFFNDAARRVHASILDGSLQGRHVPASRSGHDVHREDPDLVAREIVRAVRRTNGWNR